MPSCVWPAQLLRPQSPGPRVVHARPASASLGLHIWEVRRGLPVPPPQQGSRPSPLGSVCGDSEPSGTRRTCKLSRLAPAVSLSCSEPAAEGAPVGAARDSGRKVAGSRRIYTSLAHFVPEGGHWPELRESHGPAGSLRPGPFASPLIVCELHPFDLTKTGVSLKCKIM